MCSHCRQTQSQQKRSVSRSASPSLLDVLHQVPTLPELLTADSQKALSASCRSLRERFIAQIQVVTVMCAKDYALVVRHKWPQLNMVILILQQDQQSTDRSCVSDRILFDILVSAEGSNKRAIVSMLKPLHAPATESACTPLALHKKAAQQLAHQLTIKWPRMDIFMLMDELDGLGMEIASQLVQGTWTSLAYLALSGCELRAAECSLLSQGNWPVLWSLNVSNNCLDAEAMAFLVRGNWPLLTRIDLGSNPTLDAVAIAHLSAANWPVALMILSQTPVSVDMAAELADLQLPTMMRLCLDNTGLTASAVSELARADWPSLTFVSFDHDNLHAIGMHLGLDLDKVQKLKSDAHVCDVVCQRKLISQSDVGLWPNLNKVKISKHRITLAMWLP